MAEVRWTPQSAEDIRAIAEFIAADSPHFARLFVLDILHVVDRLSSLPRSGRVVPELSDKSVREVLLGSYRIVYRIGEDLIEILTIWHGARLLDPGQLD